MNELTGKKFGKLSVVSRSGSHSTGHATWLCQCECGKEIIVSSGNLTRASKPTRSCGCQVYLKGKDSPHFKGYEGIHAAWWSIHVRNPARRRNIALNITMKQAWELFEKQNRACALTNLPIEISLETEKNTASLDRIDSHKGYELDNIQWLHKHINKMKNDLDQNYFIEMCKSII